MKSSAAAASTITTVSLQGGWLKLLQARSVGEGPASLLGMKARDVRGLNEEQAAAALQQLIRSLPYPPTEALGLIPTGEVLTRYLTLPSEDPAELNAMALYQLEGVLPYPINECVTSVKRLNASGEATRVLAAAVHRPNIERMIRICRLAGLKLTGIAASSEAIGRWHRACWPGGDYPEAWLVAELTREGLDMGILVNGSLVYMRQVQHLTAEFDDLAGQLHDTMRAYEREQVGPPVKQITISGSLGEYGPGALERLETSLELPVQRVDPLETSPFRETLGVTAQELAPEVSFSELLGAVVAPRLIDLDLLPIEIRVKQVRHKLVLELRRTGALAAAVIAIVAFWIGMKLEGIWWQSAQAKQQLQQLRPQMDRVKATAASVRAVTDARDAYAYQMQSIAGALKHLAAGMSLQFIGLEGDRTLSIRGMSSDFAQVSSYSAQLRNEGLWEQVTLRSAKNRTYNGVTGVEFDLLLGMRGSGKERRR